MGVYHNSVIVIFSVQALCERQKSLGENDIIIISKMNLGNRIES